MTNFISRWQRRSKEEKTWSTFKESTKSSEPIRPKLKLATQQIQGYVSKVEQAAARVKERDTFVFSQVVSAVRRNDNKRAKMLANELTEIRKMKLILMQSRLALEQLVLRLSTVSDLGDIAGTLAPAMNVIKNVRPGLTNLVPDAEREIGEVSSLLSEIIVESRQMNPSITRFQVIGDEAEDILEEAGLIARHNLDLEFTQVPTTERTRVETE